MAPREVRQLSCFQDFAYKILSHKDFSAIFR